MKNKMKKLKMLGFGAMAFAPLAARADDAALISAVNTAIQAAGTGLSTILIAVIAVVGSLILFKLIKRGANKV